MTRPVSGCHIAIDRQKLWYVYVQFEIKFQVSNLSVAVHRTNHRHYATNPILDKILTPSDDTQKDTPPLRPPLDGHNVDHPSRRQTRCRSHGIARLHLSGSHNSRIQDLRGQSGVRCTQKYKFRSGNPSVSAVFCGYGDNYGRTHICRPSFRVQNTIHSVILH